MTDLEFLKAYHQLSKETKASVDRLLLEGQQRPVSQVTDCDTGRVVLDLRYLYRSECQSGSQYSIP